ncbi:MAG: HAD family hydrolase [Micropruina sp.]
MAKAVFIDYDGTYADRGQIPAGHVEAVRHARENGHHVLLCTGRPKSMVPSRILDSVFDGLIGAGGGYVEIDGTLLADIRFPPDLATQVVDLLTAYDASFILEAPGAVYGRIGVRERMHETLTESFGPGSEEGVNDILANLQVTDDLGEVSFGKVTVFSSPIPVDELARMMGPLVGALPNSVTGPGDHSGEIHLRDVNKATGIEIVAAHLGISRSDTIGAGDGFNDLEMLAYAGTALVVEGSPPELLALADLIIAPPGREGLVRGFAELGLTTASVTG